MEITLPALGENIDSATVTKVLVKVGDTIQKDQPIMELDTEKASVDVPASSSGTVKEIRVKEGDVLNVGQVVLILEESGKSAGSTSPKAEPEQSVRAKRNQKKKRRPKKRPPHPSARRLNPSIILSRHSPWKLSRNPYSAVCRQRLSCEGWRGNWVLIFMRLQAPGRTAALPRKTSGTTPGPSFSTPAAPEVADKPARLPDFSRWGEIERKAMSSIRRTIAEHVHDAWTSIPHVTHFDAADITELETFRKSFAGGESGQGKLTMTAIAMKVVSEALKVFPQFNVTLDPEAAEVIYKKYCHIGVAVDTEHGLLVPVIRDVDKKGVLKLAVELAEAAGKARNRKLSIEDMQGGTFTITNLGGIGGANFTPIINSPEVAILGISRANFQPVFREGEITPRLILPLALSFDHRVVDGADAARFLRWVAEAFEQPIRLALQG